MKQKQPKPKRLNYKKLLMVVSGVLVVLLLTGQILFDVYIYQNSIQPVALTPITNLIINAVDGLHKPAPIDPQTGKIYFPEAKLVLPPPPDSHMQLVYSNVGENGAKAELEVTTKDILHQAEAKLWAGSSGQNKSLKAVFDQVPNLQACARGVQLFFHSANTDAPQFQLKYTKVLANGQTLYYYTESTCQEEQSQLLNYLKQAESY